VGDRGPTSADEIRLGIGQIGRMRDDDIGGQESQRIEIARAALGPTRDHRGDLFLRLGQVDEHARAGVNGHAPDAAEQIGATGVGGVWREPGPDA
jgi:hypothetical protein